MSLYDLRERIKSKIYHNRKMQTATEAYGTCLAWLDEELDELESRLAALEKEKKHFFSVYHDLSKSENERDYAYSWMERNTTALDELRGVLGKKQKEGEE